uniref:Ig-like domain-containing protein n=1 Tax=Oryzias sinensis TaxID=183150 RepID=A0A8C7WUY4_9TELE
MLSVQTSVFTLLCEELTAVKKEESTLEGTSVTLSYKYKNAAKGNDYFFWYRQFPGKPPEFLISHTGTSLKLQDPVPGFSFKVNTSTELTIRELTLADTALYYCARLYKNLKTDMGLLFKEGGSGFQSTASYQMDSVHSCLIRVSVVTAANETLWEDSHEQMIHVNH